MVLLFPFTDEDTEIEHRHTSNGRRRDGMYPPSQRRGWDRGGERGLPPVGEDSSTMGFPQEQEVGACRKGTRTKPVSV